MDYRFGDADEDDYVSLTLGEASLGIGREPDAPDAATGDRVALWFYVDDVDAAFASLDAGGRRRSCRSRRTCRGASGSLRCATPTATS